MQDPADGSSRPTDNELGKPLVGDERQTKGEHESDAANGTTASEKEVALAQGKEVCTESRTSRDEDVHGKEVATENEKEVAKEDGKEAVKEKESGKESEEGANTAEEVAEDESKYLSGLKLGILSLGLCLTTFVIALDNTIIATAIPKITTVFNSLEDVGWYGSSYLLTTCSLQPVSTATTQIIFTTL